MKARIIYLSALMLVSVGALAQTVENDDMYFNAKDRAKLNASKPVKFTAAKAEEQEIHSPLNPTDSYSARNVNPEYISRSQVDPSSQNQANAQYFLPNYQPKGVNQSLTTGGYSGSNAWNNPYYYSPYSSYGFGSPYSSFYPYNSWGMMSPMGYGNYFSPGWSNMLSLSYGFGNGWNMWGSPSMSFWNNYYGMNSYYGSPWMYNSYGYGYPYSSYYGYSNYSNVVVINNDNSGRGYVYGKRTSRSNDYDNTYVDNGRSNSAAVVDSHGRSRGSNGRFSDNENSTYYNPGWRRDPSSGGNSGSSWGNAGRTDGNSNSWFNNNNSNSGSRNSWFDNNSGSRNSNWSNSSIGNNNSNFGGVRGGGGAGSSHTGGRTRGRD